MKKHSCLELAGAWVFRVDTADGHRVCICPQEFLQSVFRGEVPIGAVITYGYERNGRRGFETFTYGGGR